MGENIVKTSAKEFKKVASYSGGATLFEEMGQPLDLTSGYTDCISQFQNQEEEGRIVDEIAVEADKRTLWLVRREPR